MSFTPIVITGASGFIGNSVVRRLLQRGDNVYLLLRAEANTWRLHDILERVTVHRVDMRDATGMRRVLERIGPKTILHAAALGTYEQQADAREILETNVLGSFNLLEAAVAVDTKLFVNIGSSSEYGHKHQPMSEQDRLDPVTFYAVAKSAQTHLCSVMARSHTTNIVTLRLLSVYGPWEKSTRLLPNVIRRARAGLPLEMSSPETARDFIYIDDVLDALLDFNRLSKFNSEIFNIGTGLQSTLRDVVRTVQDIVGGRSEVRWQARPAQQWDTDSWQADVSKARTVLGWTPRHSLADGVAQLAKWMAEQGDDYDQS